MRAIWVGNKIGETNFSLGGWIPALWTYDQIQHLQFSHVQHQYEASGLPAAPAPRAWPVRDSRFPSTLNPSIPYHVLQGHRQ